MLLQRILQTVAECLFFLFFFLKNSSYSSLPLQTRTWPLTQPNSPTRPGTDRVRVRHCPASTSQPASTVSVGAHRPCVFATLSLFPLCDFKHPGPSWCCSNLVWQGREPLTWLSPKNPAADLAGARPGAAAALVPLRVPGTLLS